MQVMKHSVKTSPILVLLLGLLAGTLPAGDLNPPGPPNPTMKTLDDVEPRIPIAGSDTAVGTFVISRSGSYYLTGDRLCTNTGIQINADNVTLDLMGYSLKGPDAAGTYGIYTSGRKNVEIRNGTIRDFQHGIYTDTPDDQMFRIMDIRSVSNIQDGINLNGKYHLIQHCILNENSRNGIYTEQYSTILNNIVSNNGYASADAVYGIRVRGDSGNIISGNAVYDNGQMCQSIVYGINVPGGTVADNAVYNNGNSADSFVYGIRVHIGTVTGNTVYKNGFLSSSYVYGIRAGNGSTVTGNTIYENGVEADSYVYGLYVSRGCTVDRNTVLQNGYASHLNVYGVYTEEGCTVTGNTICRNGISALSNVYGIRLDDYCLVDQNSIYGNGISALSSINMNLNSTCVYGNNVAP